MITHMKRNKSPGADNVLNECLIFRKGSLIQLITLILNILYNTSTFPEQWSEGIVIPIYKKGDTCAPSNYRPITLLSCVSKVFTSILCKRITNWATDNFIFSEAQFGIRPGYSTIDAIFTLSSLIRQGKPGQKFYCAFIDFYTAFDSVNRDLLYSQLVTYGVSTKMIAMIIELYSTVTSRVKVNNTLSDSFECRNGLRQGESLSPVLFAMHVNDINDAYNDHTDHTIIILLYADDLVIIANTRLDLQRKLDRLHQYCIKKCLSVNIKKSKILVINSRKPTGSFRFSTDTLEEVDSFKYLGVTFCRNGSFFQAQENLASQARRAQASLGCYIMQHKHLPVDVIFELFDTLIKPMLLYGSEIYGSSMSKDIEQVMLILLRKH